MLTGTDLRVPEHYPLNRVVTLTNVNGEWGLGQTASNFTTAISATAALLQAQLDGETRVAGTEGETSLGGARLLTEDDYWQQKEETRDKWTQEGGEKDWQRVDPEKIDDTKIREGVALSIGDKQTKTYKSEWLIADVQRIYKDAKLVTKVLNDQNRSQKPRKSWWFHNQRHQKAVGFSGKVERIYGPSRANDGIWKNFKFSSSYRKTVDRGGQVLYEFAERCARVRDIGKFHPNLGIGETGSCISFLIKSNPKEFGKNLAEKFWGWHYSSSNALGRTTHCIISKKRFEHVEAYLKDFTPASIKVKVKSKDETEVEVESNDEPEGEYRYEQNNRYDFYVDLQALLSRFNRSQPNLIENAQVVVKGPGERAVATLCVVNNHVRPSPTYYLVLKEICGHLDDILRAANNGGDWDTNGQPLNTFFWYHYLNWGDRGRARIDDFILEKFSKETAKYDLLQLISQVYTQMLVRADGGTHQKHLLGANEAMYAVLTSCRRLLLSKVSITGPKL